ncbi:hypothetical protein [Spartinivicinus ruber]|uniref:hypothetical protein n=1 Tax=Spartinivicinus ruber TaxID=2683272 RepID=UPI0013D84886|nr:hypothetical protein [Spartinivicinus ruber]
MSLDLISDWLDFCDGSKNFDPSHFYTLFMEDISTSDINRIYFKYPQAKNLTSRLNRIKNSQSTNTPCIKERVKTITELVLSDIKEKLRVCESCGDKELESILNSAADIQLVNQNDYFKFKDAEDAWPMKEVMILLGDHFRESMGEYSKMESALIEACYGTTNDYNLVWYLLAPLANTTYNTEYYAELWELGAEYFLSEKKIYIWDRLA